MVRFLLFPFIYINCISKHHIVIRIDNTIIAIEFRHNKSIS